MLEKVIARLDDANFVERFTANPDGTLVSEFNISLADLMADISRESSEKYERFMSKLASVLNVECMTSASMSCCS